ncbi:MAG: group II intron reverse transcriptase/maturase [Nitrospiraceae bacterium]
MTDRTNEAQPAAVSDGAKQAGEIWQRWSWVERTVWTERMLTALEQGVRGGKWFSLMDKVTDPKTLWRGFEQVKANQGAAGVDRQSVEDFERHLIQNLKQLSEQLRAGTFQPQPVRRKWIDKLGSKEKRPLGIPTVRDRVVQAALRMVLEPIFERDFAEPSYGFRPNRGCKDALRRVDHLLKQGYAWVVDADLKSYFDTIPQDRLKQRVEEKVSDGRVIGLVEQYLQQQVMDSGKSWTPEAGTPQGAVLSPLLSNIYLDPLDRAMAAAGIEMVRYADDFVILSRSQREAEHALEQVRQWTVEAGLMLHPVKTRIVDATQPGGFDFLGYHFERGMRWPSKRSERQLREKVRAKTGRMTSGSLDAIVTALNPVVRGWYEYFKHSQPTTFRTEDGWVRGRLRSILRQRSGQQGRGSGTINAGPMPSCTAGFVFS